MPTLLRAPFALVLVLLCAGACKRSEQPAPSPAGPAKPAVVQPVVEDAKASAEQLFRQRCTVCHGATGNADGPGAAALTPKPRAFSDASWQESVTDAHLREIIVKGGAALKLSPGMPANPDLATKPAVVDELVKLLRSLKGHT